MTIDMFITISIVLLGGSAAVSANTTHYVGTNSTECEQCKEASEYTNNVDKYFTDDVTFCFVSGDHYIQQENNSIIVVSNIANLSLLGYAAARCRNGSSSRTNESKIHCISTSFAFTNISGLTIDCLTFIDCGHSDLSAHFHVIQPESNSTVIRAGVFLQNITTNTSISHVCINDSQGFGLWAINAFSVSITNSHFDGNNKKAQDALECCKDCGWKNCSNKHRGGNALLTYTDQNNGEVHHSSSLLIADSTFNNGLAVYCKGGHSLICSSGGLTVVLAQTTFAVTANITRVTATGNSGYKGGNAAFLFHSYKANSTVTIENSKFTKGNIHILPQNGLIGDSGGGIGFYYGFPAEPISNERKNYSYATDIFTIKHSVISGNMAVRCGGFCALIRNSAAINANQVTISLENCTFENNEAIFGLAMQVRVIEGEERLISSEKSIHVTIKDTTFLNNVKLDSDQHNWTKSNSFVLTHAIMTRLPHYGTVWLSMVNTNITNCTFMGNTITALSAFETIITFKGSNKFINNSADNGGGLALLGNSVVYFAKHSSLSFINNSAISSGGAMYVDQRYLSCFFQIRYEVGDTKNTCDELNITVYFENNKAKKGGRDLYGGYLDGCWLDTVSYQGFKKSENLSKCLFNQFEDNMLSRVSSAPTGVCFCPENNTINCEDKELPLQEYIYPGQRFSVTALAVGQRNGSSAAVIVAKIKNSNINGAELSKTSIAQQTEISCSSLEYSINVNDATLYGDLHIELSVEGVPVSNHLGNFRTVVLTLKPCPPGFNLSSEGPGCECNENLSELQKQGVINCHSGSNSLSVNRTKESKTVWLSPVFNQSKYEGLVVNHYCPLGHCTADEVTINLSSSALDDLDVQCCCDHTGLLCGACKTGFSVALGSDKCLQCTNLNLLLLIFFTAAGILLVLALFLTNITVTMGSINAIIFYANMITANKSIFFEHTTFNGITVFIDWLNLDLGIKTCFYSGLDMYVKTWMQFLFPLYLLGILAVLIMGSRSSSTLSKLLGNRAVPVLATLFLLSFTKIIRTTLNAIAITNMMYPNGTLRTVWMADGNISLMDGKLIVLGITALAVVVFLSVPYTLLMLFGQCLQAKSHYKLLEWVNRLKPIYDAYQAPFKPRHRYWTGFLLLIRTLLFVLLPILSIGHTAKTLLIFLTTMIVIITIFLHDGGMYKSKIINFIELSIHLNLALLTGVMFYIASMDESDYKKKCQKIVALTSVAIVFVTATVTMLFHCISQTSFYKTHIFSSLLDRCATKIFRKDAPNKSSSIALCNLEDSNSTEMRQFFPPSTDVNLREPLLADTL